MKLFRNAELGRSLLLFLAISLVGVSVAFAWELRFGVMTLILCAALLCVFLVTTLRRYHRLSEFAADINKILHGSSQISLNRYAEGELGILQSEIYKMTVRLREQQQRLIDDKVYLADSIADISHQIRTPLTSINLLVSLLSEPDISDERRQALSRELYDLLSRIDWLITSLLKISRLDAGTVSFQKEQVPLEELIGKACGPVLIPMELRGQELSVSANGSFTGDTAWTAEALGNIVKNCMEHTPQGGRITIRAVETALYSEIVISDSGSGIAPEDLPHIFERFYKGRNSDERSFGVGLALARMIIGRQNGTVKAENRTGGGACFTVRFYKGTV